jgi:NAD+ synthase (glutamine-hydrolysing)
MRIGVLQINSTLGDFSGNAQKIVEGLRWAKDQRCDLAIFPECALMGYHPVDLLERTSVVEEQLRHLALLHQQIPKSLTAIVGAITKSRKKHGKPFQNSAVVLRKGKKPVVFAKQLLPTYDVFDEARHIEPGDLRKNIFRVGRHKVLVSICEDIWAWKQPGVRSPYGANPLLGVKPGSVDLVVNLSASPFTDEKADQRRFVVSRTARQLRAPVVYANLVGGQDELVFDGRSLWCASNGRICHEGGAFQEDRYAMELAALSRPRGLRPAAPAFESGVDARARAIELGLRDFVRKSGFRKAHLGLSGGIDSAVVAALAVRALGPEKVSVLALPGPFSQPQSEQLAVEQAHRMGVSISVISIQRAYEQFLAALGRPAGDVTLVEENLQARIRATLLMAYSNREQSLLINTSNKSEMAVGYTTIYGDMCGAICPLGDVLKTEVYQLAAFLNSEHEWIPRAVIERAPSAELRPNQKDQDSLPAYDELDAAVERLVEGFAPPTNRLDQRVLEMLMKSEFKRWQSPPVLKLTAHAFGRGRRLPIAHRAFF